MGGWLDGWMDGWVGGSVDGWMDANHVYINTKAVPCFHAVKFF